MSALCPVAIVGQKAQFYVFDGKKVKSDARSDPGQNIEVVGEQLLFDDNIECDKHFEEDGIVNMIGARVPQYLEPIFKLDYDPDVCKQCEFELMDEEDQDDEFKQ